MELPPRPKLFDFHGVSMIHHFTDNWENIRNFQARPDDILIATYPKAGTTWVSYILDLLYFGQTAPERQTSLPIYERVPFLESDFHIIPPGTELADKLSTSPRLIKTHLPVQLVPKSFWEQNCRIVYVARNAKDNAVSYFHFDRMNQAHPEPGDWNNFLQRFMDGKMVFGSWYDHVTGWWERKQTHSKLHYVFYEDMVEDTRRELDRLCSFLGLSPSAEEKERVRGGVQFDTMKKNSMANYSTLPIMDIKISPFMRKGRPLYFSPIPLSLSVFLSASTNFSAHTLCHTPGKVGDWKNHFTVAQSEQFDGDYKKKMKNTTVQFRTVV
uniref:Sulfotransferase n=2 Tax=Oncorhynchus mykiss TaxID=8022 RepID=A0A8C7SX97_ONCMY